MWSACAERRLDVAEADPPARMALVHERVVAPVGHDRRARLERLLDVEDRGQLLEVEADLRDGLVGRLLGLGHDGHDRLALEADAVLGQHELLFGLDADEPEDRVPVVRDVRRGQGPDEPGNALGLGQVDAPDLRVMERAPDHLEVEHAGEDAVGRELRPPGHVADAVAPADRLADDVELGLIVPAPARYRPSPRPPRRWPGRSACSRCTGRCCPSVPSAISSALGAGSWSSSALVSMTMPGVQ